MIIVGKSEGSGWKYQESDRGFRWGRVDKDASRNTTTKITRLYNVERDEKG